MTDTEMKEFERRLDNWRMVVTGQAGVGHCGSVESLYRGDRDEDRRKPSLVIDELDGWKVEDAWKAMPLSHYRWLLKLHYVRRSEQRHVIRAVLHHTGHAIKRWHYRAELINAVMQLRKALDILHRQSHHLHPQSELDSSSLMSVGRREAVFARPDGTEPAAAT